MTHIHHIVHRTIVKQERRLAFAKGFIVGLGFMLLVFILIYGEL